MKADGIVISLGSGRCRIFADGREIDCLLPPELAKRQSSMLAVGDRVTAEPADGGTWRIREVLPRRTVLSRPDPLQPKKERLVAANVDLVINVVSVKAPPLRIRLSLATSLQRPATPVQKATLDLVRAILPSAYARH